MRSKLFLLITLKLTHFPEQLPQLPFQQEFVRLNVSCCQEGNFGNSLDNIRGLLNELARERLSGVTLVGVLVSENSVTFSLRPCGELDC